MAVSYKRGTPLGGAIKKKPVMDWGCGTHPAKAQQLPEQAQHLPELRFLPSLENTVVNTVGLRIKFRRSESPVRFRAKREKLMRFEGRLPESLGKVHLAKAQQLAGQAQHLPELRFLPSFDRTVVNTGIPRSEQTAPPSDPMPRALWRP